MGLDGKLGLIETGNGHGDVVGVLTGTLDIVGRVALGLLGLAELSHRTDDRNRRWNGRAGKINVTHGVLLGKRRIAIFSSGTPCWPCRNGRGPFGDRIHEMGRTSQFKPSPRQALEDKGEGRMNSRFSPHSAPRI